MAIAITKGSRKYGFLNKLLSAYGGAHIHNVTLVADHDNFDLVVKGDWVGFDNYEEDASETVSFSGIIRGLSSEGTWYIEVVSSNALLVYNSPVSPYSEKEFQDEGLFYNEAGDTTEGHVLVAGDIFSVSPNGFTGTPAEDKTVTYANGKYVVGA